MNNCDLNSLTTEWFVDVRINSVQVISYSFFNGFGYNNLITSAPSLSAWKNALTFALEDLVNLGYDYYFTNKGRLVVYSLLCPEEEQQFDFKLNVGINFSILCS
jgi:nucleoside-specific outer membrane channel protein Tsx